MENETLFRWIMVAGFAHVDIDMGETACKENME